MITNQEAIRLIRNLPTMCEFTDAYGEPIDSVAYYEAIELAISALQAQDVPDTNVGDMISRHTAIDAFYKHPNINWTTLDVLTKINALPSAQLEPSQVARDIATIIENEKDMRVMLLQSEWDNHTVASLLAELFDDPCACNYNGIDEWLPEKCEVIDACPNPVGVACWEQYLKHRAERRTDD